MIAVMNENPMPPLSEEDLGLLEGSVKAIGFLTPVLKSAGPYRPGAIIDGNHRTAVGLKLGVKPPEDLREIHDEHEFRIAQIEANLKRRQLTDAQRASMGLKLLEIYKARAAERIVSGRPLEENEESGRATEQAAKQVGLKRYVIEAAKFVYESGSPELIRKVEAGEVKFHQAAAIIKKDRGVDPHTTLTRRVAERLDSKPPRGSFGAVVVAPQLRTQLTKAEKGRLTPREIETLDVPSLASADAIVALIVTPFWLGEGLDVLDAWDLRHFGTITWALNEPVQGEYLSERCRYILLGTKGKYPPPSRKRDLIIGNSNPTVPGELIDVLDEWVTDRAGLLMFGQTRRDGWESWKPTIDGV